jgi:beta-1,2-mannobiose phosphorylase / 1,2-beta-oligomannan phosphorylase
MSNFEDIIKNFISKYSEFIVIFSTSIIIALIFILILRLINFIYHLIVKLIRFISLSNRRKRSRKLKISIDAHHSKAHHAKRHKQNPLISPSIENEWEYGGTFNPAAWHDENGNAHLIYRAIGIDGVSRLGYAMSENGESFDRLPYPVFFMESPRLLNRNAEKSSKTGSKSNCLLDELATEDKRYDPVMYPSGGSWGGCEDPRMVLIDDRFYVTFSAFDGWDFIRIALTTISKEDFLANRWKWSKPILISPENQINKNWVIFPEKIKGKFAILHSISPEIQVDYIDSLTDIVRGVKKIKSVFGAKKEREEWDTWPRGVGAPPIRTKAGWLVLYHATDKTESHKYKLGAMILDIDNPQIVLMRSSQPILTPDEWYENDGKPGVVYVCGAVIQDDVLYIYYGGGDKHVCVAHMSVDKLLGWLENNNTVKI